MSASFATGVSDSLHGNHANNFLERGHSRLQFVQSVLLHPAHSRGAGRGSNQIGFICAAQDGTDRLIDDQ